MAGNYDYNISHTHSFMRLLEEGFEGEGLMDFILNANSSMEVSREPIRPLRIPRAQQTSIPSSTPLPLTNPQSLRWSLENNSGSTSSNENIHKLSATDLLLAVSISSEEKAPKIMKLALEAMEELRRLALDPGAPLWKLDLARNIQTLDAVEYTKLTGDINAMMIEINKQTRVNSNEASKRQWTNNYCGHDKSVNGEFFESLASDLFVNNNHDSNNQSPQDHLYSEGSRDIVYVRMRPLEIVELLMNLEKWSQVFCDIVTKTSALGVLTSSGVQGNYDNTLQVLKTEFRFPGPLVPSRRSCMARFCKRLGQGVWGVVDVSLEKLLEFSYPQHFLRRPSGCLIEQTPNGSKVTWVENVAVDNSKIHGIFQQMVSSGFAFSAKRWVETIARYRESYSSPSRTTVVNPFADAALSVHEIGKRSLLKLSERIVKRFLDDISGSTTNKWIDLSPIPNDKAPMLMATKTYKGDPGKPSGISTYFATSLGLQIPPNILFDFLRKGKSRPKWDFMCFGRHSINEIVRVNTSADPTNYVSLIQVKSAPATVARVYLQESHTNSLGSYVIYSPLELWSTSMILGGGDPEIVEILPSGFVIHSNGGVENNESILTVALHFIDQVAIRGITPRSLESMNSILDNSIISIKSALIPNYRNNQGAMESNKRLRIN